MECPPPDDKGGTDINTDNTKGSYNIINFNSIGPMPLEEGREEEEERRQAVL